MDNNNNNESKNNYVTPERVDLTKVDVSQNNNGFLGQERDNIISASIQANQAINESQAKDVNNTIKVKKKSSSLSVLAGVFFIAIACVLAYFGYRILNKYVKYDEAKHTTTTTTTVKVNHFKNYIYDDTKLRKLQNDTSILILLPKMEQNNNRYIFTVKDETGVIKREEGTYNIQNQTISMVSSGAVARTFNIDEHSISYAGGSMEMYDQEIKYYVNKSKDINSILVMNGTVDNTFAYYCGEGIQSFSEFEESKTNILLNNGMNFTKKGLDLEYNGLEFKHVDN